MAAKAVPSAGSDLDIPHLLRPRPLQAAREVSPISVPVRGEPHGQGEEFDFSDVFGHVQNGHEQVHENGRQLYVDVHPSPLNTTDDGSSAEHLASWAPPESISEGKPLVINHRSHSLVGPAVTPRLILNHHNGAFSLKSENDAKVHPLERCEEVTEAIGKNEVSHVEAVVVHTTDVHAMGLTESSGESSGDDEAPVDKIARGDEAQGADEAASVEGIGRPFTRKLGPNDFELLRVVGQGAFGKVFQVKKKDTGEILAMKVMRKDKIMEKNHSEYMKAERDILTKAVHPFIVQLQHSFQTKTKLYLLLDFINGGHLFFQLYRQGTFSEELAKIYTAEIVLAVAHLHKMGIIHRDLKPENILLDSEGHVKLTDFGLAKEIRENDKSNSLCGTMEYMAPEIILAKGHGCAADWWSVGILLFEMLTGQPPFAHNNRQKLQQKIIKDKIKLPPYLTSEANNLLKGLLLKDPSKRLGNGPSGSEDIKSHKWFKGLNWKKLEAREIQPKFCPTVNGKHCTANFDEMWTSMPVQDSPAGTPTSDGIEILNLRGYTYSAPMQWLPTVDSDSQGEESGTDDESDDE